MQDKRIAVTLQEGNVIDRLKLHGRTMTPIIKPGQCVKVEPSFYAEIKAGDIVLCKVRDSYYIHNVTKIQEDQFQIGNSHGFIKGWISKNEIYGIVTDIFD